jgi:hypothetical protein
MLKYAWMVLPFCLISLSMMPSVAVVMLFLPGCRWLVSRIMNYGESAARRLRYALFELPLHESGCHLTHDLLGRTHQGADEKISEVVGWPQKGEDVFGSHLVDESLDGLPVLLPVSPSVSLPELVRRDAM